MAETLEEDEQVWRQRLGVALPAADVLPPFRIAATPVFAAHPVDSGPHADSADVGSGDAHPRVSCGTEEKPRSLKRGDGLRTMADTVLVSRGPSNGSGPGVSEGSAVGIDGARVDASADQHAVGPGESKLTGQQARGEVSVCLCLSLCRSLATCFSLTHTHSVSLTFRRTAGPRRQAHAERSDQVSPATPVPGRGERDTPTGVLHVKVSISAHGLPADGGGAWLVVRGTQGGGRVLARTSPQPGTQAVWGEVALGLRKDVTIALQCWRRAPGAGTDSLVGSAAVRVGDLVREGHVVALQLDGAAAPATLRVHSAEVAQQELAASSVVCMLRDRLFHSEGSEVRPSGGDHGTAPSGEAASQQRDVARCCFLRVHRLDQTHIV